MPREIGIAVFIALGVGLLLLMLVSWRRRKARQAGLGAPEIVPPDPGVILLRAAGLYLATTPEARRLDRIAIRPFGFRAAAELTVTDRGIVVSLVGSDPWFIPKADLTGFRRASWTIDRGVEEDGLNLVAWNLGDTGLESYFRLRDPQAFENAIATIAPTIEGTPA